MGRSGVVPGTRELVLTRFKIVISYTTENDDVWVMSVFRTERQRFP